MMKIFEKTWLFFFSAMIVGLFFPQFGKPIEPYLMYLLMFLMAFSIKDISLSDLFNKKAFKIGLAHAATHYIFQGGIIILAAWLILGRGPLFTGFVVMASVPAAISVIPYAKLIRGNLGTTTMGLTLIYVLSLLITPLGIWLFFRESVDIFEIFRSVLLFIVIPFIFSRLIRRFNDRIKGFDKPFLNILFFVLIYSFVSLNSTLLMEDLGIFWMLSVVNFIRTILVAVIAFFAARRFGNAFAGETALFAVHKNQGYAALIALSLFSPEAALPATVGIIFENLAFLVIKKMSGA